MRVVHSPLHLLHEPPFEVFSGHPGPAWEVTARAESIRAALAADPAFALELPAEHGLEPALAVHEPGLVRLPRGGLAGVAGVRRAARRR